MAIIETLDAQTFVKILRTDVENPSGGAGVVVAVDQDLGRQRFVEIRQVQAVDVANFEVLRVFGVATRPEKKVDVVGDVTRRRQRVSADQEHELV